MKICKIIIKGFQQFQDFELDMTYPIGHPKAGEPLEKVCLIGSNGTGKSTLLEIFYRFIPYKNTQRHFTIRSLGSNQVIKYKFDSDYYYQTIVSKTRSNVWLKGDVDSLTNWQDFFFNPDLLLSPQKELLKVELQKYILTNIDIDNIIYSNPLQNNANDLLIYAPAEGQHNGYHFEDVPKVTLNDSLKLFEDFSFDHTISSDTINDFWKLLIYLIKKRENDFNEYLNQEKNSEKPFRQLREEFDKLSPKILDGIAVLWNKILDKAGLEFDVQNASNPIQLNDNLKAYIKIKGTDKTLPYSELSTGIRNFIFRVGHIYALYFNRDIQRGFLLLDEPENSLYPDFLYDLIDLYTGIIQNTQFITATHNPIIAAQFEPYERFLLEFDEHGTVHAKRGITPIGDDPNDLLEKDFGVRNLLGKEGIKKWERYVELKRLIKKEENPDKKTELLEEFMKIGNDYNFSV